MSDKKMVGRLFVTIDGDGMAGYQGEILSETPIGYLCQLFEWVAGHESDQKILPFEEFSGALFFKNSDDLKDWYEHRYKGTRA